MERPVGMALQPSVNRGRPVRGDVVEDDVHRASGCYPLGDMIEEGEELLRVVPVAMSRAASRHGQASWEARPLRPRLPPRRAHGVPEQPVDARGEEAGPPDVLPDAPRVVGDVFETRAPRPKA